MEPLSHVDGSAIRRFGSGRADRRRIDMHHPMLHREKKASVPTFPKVEVDERNDRSLVSLPFGEDLAGGRIHRNHMRSTDRLQG